MFKVQLCVHVCVFLKSEALCAQITLSSDYANIQFSFHSRANICLLSSPCIDMTNVFNITTFSCSCFVRVNFQSICGECVEFVA